LLFYLYAAQGLSNVQAPFSGGKAILPALSRTIHMESGIENEHGLPFTDDRRAAVSDDFVLDVYVYRNDF
jgi:hypothetical protein